MRDKSSSYWITDEQVVYGNCGALKGADASSFQILNETWAKDAKRVYSVGMRLLKADAPSFHVLNGLYAKDKNYCYYLYGIIGMYFNLTWSERHAS